MATYKEFEKYVSANFKVQNNPPNSPKGFMTIDIDTGGGRSQIIFVGHAGNEVFGDTADVISFIGEITGKKLEKALEVAYGCVFGGLVKIGDAIAYRCTIILENVDENEIDKPLLMAAHGADRLEKLLTGEDTF